MIRDVAELADDAVLQAEVGVIGAGFAGIELARYLDRNGVDMVLLESGRADFDPGTQALTRVESVGKLVRGPDPDGDVTPYLEPIFRGETRIRQLGGTSNIWTGKWRPFDSLSFDPRPWIPHARWPIGLDELRPFYAEVARDYGLPDLEHLARDVTSGPLGEIAAAAGMKTSVHYWERTPLRLSSTYLPELRRSANVELVVGANATEIVLEENLEHVREVRFQSLGGRRFTLLAARFVLATGGLEAPRLLLASNRQIPVGLGNARDLVGRFYMDHPKHKLGKLRPGPGMRQVAQSFAIQPRPRAHVNLSLANDVQRSEALLDHAIFLSPSYRYMVDYPLRAVEAIKEALRATDVRRLGAAAVPLAASPHDLWKVVQRQVYRDRRGPLAHYATTMYVEQAPNPDSRVYLGAKCDALGMPKLVIDWRLAPLDHEVFAKLLRRLPEAFQRAGLGQLDFGPDPVSHSDTAHAAHHIGATRMASTPAEGVVDADCKVFGTDNLFIAANSVFPTGDSATPTLTLLALARRLGAHVVGLRAGDAARVRAHGATAVT